MINEGLIILLVGMSVVFTFLIVMVVCMTGMSSIIQRLFPDNTPEHADNNDTIAIAIAVAYSKQG